VTTQHHT